MRLIGNSWSELGQAPTIRQSRDLALVAIAVGAIASASVGFALVDLASTKTNVSFVPARAFVTDASATPQRRSEQEVSTPKPTSAVPVGNRILAPAKPSISEIAPKSQVSNERYWWNGNRHTRAHSAYWQRPARFRSL